MNEPTKIIPTSHMKSTSLIFKYFLGPIFVGSMVISAAFVVAMPVLILISLGSAVIELTRPEADRTKTHNGPGF